MIQSFSKIAIKRERWNRAKKMRLLYLLSVIPIVLLFVFHYIPIYGAIIAFKDFQFNKGIWGSPWNNFEHFKNFFLSPYAMRILGNTLIISVLRIVFGFPAPIILAILINEIGNERNKKVIQSITYLPHFMSWVVLSGIITSILSPSSGIIPYISNLFGTEAPNLLINLKFFRPMLIVTGIWKEVGWGTVIYLAAISSISPSLYESAEIDGAKRLQRIIYITLPSLIPVITILFILRLGRILNAGFDQIFNLYNPVVYKVADIIDTYVYRIGLIDRQYDFSTAVNLFKNFIGVILILFTNSIIKRYSEYGIW